MVVLFYLILHFVPFCCCFLECFIKKISFLMKDRKRVDQGERSEQELGEGREKKIESGYIVYLFLIKG